MRTVGVTKGPRKKKEKSTETPTEPQKEKIISVGGGGEAGKREDIPRGFWDTARELLTAEPDLKTGSLPELGDGSALCRPIRDLQRHLVSSLATNTTKADDGSERNRKAGGRK